jgi:hypothetical protein
MGVVDADPGNHPAGWYIVVTWHHLVWTWHHHWIYHIGFEVTTNIWEEPL